MKSNLIILILSLLLSNTSYSSEVDNFNTEGFQKVELINTLNNYLNSGMQDVINSWDCRPDKNLEKQKRKFVHKFQKSFGEFFIFNSIDNYFKQENLYTFNVEQHIYSKKESTVSTEMKIVKPLPVFTLNDTPIGMDKIRHFMGIGYAMWMQVNMFNATVDGAFSAWIWTEYKILGQGIGGVYSNGDLVANYEGWRFFDSINNDNLEQNKEAIVKWVDSCPVFNRPIDLRDHVNSYWNEAMNPSSFRPKLQKYLEQLLPTLCDQYFERPELYLPVNEEDLIKRYKEIGLRPNPSIRMDNLCKTVN